MSGKIDWERMSRSSRRRRGRAGEIRWARDKGKISVNGWPDLLVFGSVS